MRARELFGVGVRILAVWFWTLAAYYGFWAFLNSVGTAPPNNLTTREDFSFMIFYVLVGVFLMGGARALIWLAYGDFPMTDPDAESAGGIPEPSN